MDLGCVVHNTTTKLSKDKGSTADGLKHLAFAVVLCLEQAAAGRKFALEHSAEASLCESDILKVLVRQSGASSFFWPIHDGTHFQRLIGCSICRRNQFIYD